MPGTPSPSLKRLTLDIDADLHRRLKIRSAELGVSMVDLLRGLVELALDDPKMSLRLARARHER